MRAFVTQHLLQHAGFDFVCVEGDYPDLYRPHRYAQGAGTDPSAEKAMQELQRFPQWMWRNHATRDFIEWMRRFNMQQREQLQQQQSDSAAAARGMPTPPLKGFYVRTPACCCRGCVTCGRAMLS
jgi:erythromycin esterase-like protein